MHGAAHLIAIQIESAVYLGNSGGSALKENKVVGVVRKNTSKGRKQKVSSVNLSGFDPLRGSLHNFLVVVVEIIQVFLFWCSDSRKDFAICSP